MDIKLESPVSGIDYSTMNNKSSKGSQLPSSFMPKMEKVVLVAGGCGGGLGGTGDHARASSSSSNGEEEKEVGLNEDDNDNAMEAIAATIESSREESKRNEDGGSSTGSEILPRHQIGSDHKEQNLGSLLQPHTVAVPVPSLGASGPSSGSPAPVPAPLPGYSGMMGCLDAHYPRCLMGHYF